MRWSRQLALLVGGAVATNGPPIRAQERVDWDVVARIREEGFQRSQVMNLAWYMTDVLGPRVTASPSMRKAQRWAKAKMDSIGLTTSVEPFGDHEVSWDNEYTSLHLREPDYQPLIGYPFAFTPGTEGKVVARATIAVIGTAKDFEQYRGKLRGMVVLASSPSALAPRFAADATRFATDSLLALSRATLSSPHGVSGVPYEWDPAIHWFKPVGSRSPFDFDLAPATVQRFFKAEGAAALVYAAAGGDGTVKVDQRPDGRFQRSYASAVSVPPMIALAPEHYNRIYRLVDRGFPAVLELEVRNILTRSDGGGQNVVGDLPGTDLADEVVMAGGHFDSWHAGTGATDDAAGAAVALEAVRILKAIGVEPRRTIRVALWDYEEGGKVGSVRYVQKHFANRGRKTPAYDKLSVYFNMDNGSGQFRGLYLQGNERVRPIFTAWMEPFRDLGMTTLTINDTYATDHEAFETAGLPGFQFIQDPIDYGSRAHHSNMDVYDKLVPADLRKNAVILASFLYHAAMRDERIPRKLIQ